jgi:ubiquinone/menaquinone biosynthesis C-methylase UbiE
MNEALRQYHLGELQIALDPANPRRLVPDSSGCSRILDIGCGAGQTLIALKTPAFCVGVDIDRDALRIGREIGGSIPFTAARGELLPFRDGSFDMVFSRVALPYMNIPRALREMRRVTVRGGRLWLSLHGIDMPIERFRTSGLKGKVFAAYVLANGLSFHVLGRNFPFLTGVCESFQTEPAMRSALSRAGFEDVHFTRCDRLFVVTAAAI